MKLEVTRKDIANFFPKIYLIDNSYGFLPEPFAYNSGIYGWNWNAYDLGDICLVEGVRSFPNHRRLPESAKKVIKGYKRKVASANFSERVKIDKMYLKKFIEALSND